MLIASVPDDEVPVTEMILQVATRSRSKRRIVIIDPLQSEGAKKSKYKEHQERFVNPIPQHMATARFQGRKAQSRKDKKANRRKQKERQVSVVQCNQDSVAKNLKEVGEAARGAVGTNIQSFFKTKRHRPEPEIHDSQT